MPAADEFIRLLDIMHRLRAECPWDREQTHASLRAYLLEESYEVLHALDEERYDELREELGDLMLQVVFHAEIAQEDGRFDIADVLHEINEKLVRRHPHVFADASADDAEAVLRRWSRSRPSRRRRSPSWTACRISCRHCCRRCGCSRRCARPGWSRWRSATRPRRPTLPSSA